MPVLTALLAAALAAGLPSQLPLDDAALAALPRASARLTVHGKTQRCEGVWLADLAAAAGVPAGDAVRGSALRLLIVAEAADGYRAVFSLGEIDPKLGAKPVLVARRCDGKALPAEDGPLRLVVPGERRAARSVRRLLALKVTAIE